MNPLSPSSTKVAIEDELEAIPEDETTPLKSFKEMEEEKEAEKKKQQRFVWLDTNCHLLNTLPLQDDIALVISMICILILTCVIVVTKVGNME